MSESIVLSTEPKTAEVAAHDAAMVAKVDSSAAAAEKAATPAPVETPAAERPEWLDEKFETPEDLAKAYKELSAKLGQKPAEAEGDKPAEGQEPAMKADASQAEATEALKGKGLDINQFSTEFLTNGELSEESYTKLQEAGIPKEVVDGYIAGQQAIAMKAVESAQAVVGGAEEYARMIEWAETNLTKSEQVAFDKAVTTDNMDQAKLAIAGLYARFTAENGFAPTLLDGGTGDGVSLGGFESNAQVTSAMKDPRYKTDPAYRAEVTAKIARAGNKVL